MHFIRNKRITKPSRREAKYIDMTTLCTNVRPRVVPFKTREFLGLVAHATHLAHATPESLALEMHMASGMCPTSL